MYKTTEVLHELRGRIQVQKDELRNELKSFVWEESKEYRIHKILCVHALASYDVSCELIDILIKVIKDK